MRVWIFLLILLTEVFLQCIFGVAASTTPEVHTITLNSTTTNATFTSPGFDEGQYPANSHSLWEIWTSQDQTIHLIFEFFILENHWFCDWDFVKIWEKACDDYPSASTDKYCGTKSQFSYNSSSQTLCVEFVSDIVQHRKGFKAIAKSVLEHSDISTSSPTISTTEKFSSKSKPSTTEASLTAAQPTASSSQSYTLSTDNNSTPESTTKQSVSSKSPTDKSSETTFVPTLTTNKSPQELATANITLTQGLMNGVNLVTYSEVLIETPKDSTGKYPTSFSSFVDILNPEECELLLTFDYFHVEYNAYCSWDYLILHHTHTTGPLCGHLLPKPLTTTASKITIQFYSDSVIPDQGFALMINVKRQGPDTETQSPLTTSYPKPITTTTTSSSKSITTHTSIPSSSPITTTASSTTKPFPVSSSSKPLSTLLSLSTKASSISSAPTTTPKTIESSPASTHAGPESPLVTPSHYQELSVCGNSDNSVDAIGPIVIKSPKDASGNYPVNLNCILKIGNPSKKTIKIEFVDFHVEQNMFCSWDYVTVHAQIKYGPYCGYNPPSDILTNSAEITVEFRSDSIIPDKGFTLYLVKLGEATPAPDTTVVQPPSTIVQLSSKPTSTSTTSVTDTSSSFSSISPSPPKLSSTTPSALTTLISTTKPSTASSSHQTTSKVSSNTVSSTKLPSSHKPPSTVTYTEPVKPTTMLTPTAEHTTHIPSSPSSSSSVKTSIVTPLTSATGEATSQETPGNSDIEICTQKVIEDFNQITIITEGYTDGVNYPLNQNCEMEVPGDKDDVLVMTIEEFSVEQNSYCGWDALFIHFENIIFKLCGYISNTQKLDSTDDCKYGNFVQYDDNLNKRSCFIDNYFSRSFKFTFSGSLLLRFVSDSVINQKGFKIKLQRIKSPLFTMTNPSPTPTTASPAVSASKPESTTAPITHTTDPLTPTSKTPSIQTSKESQNPIKPNFTSQSTTQKSYSTLFTNSTFAPKHTSATFDQSHTDIVSSTKHLTTQPSSDQITHVEVSDSNKEFTVTIPVQSTVTQSSGTNNHSISKTTVSQQVTTAEDSSLSTSKSSTAGISVTVSKSHTQAKTSATPKDQTTKSITAIRTSQLSSKSVSTLTTEPTSTEGILPPACSEDNMPFRLNDDIGYIESPKMSNESTYPPNTVCRWKIEDVNGQLISLIFEWFDLEQSEGCMWDKLGIFEVLTNDEMKTKAVLCGDTLPQTITASSDVLIEFSTDTQGQKTGFRLKFLKTDKANEDSSFTCPPATTPCWSSVPKSCMPVEWICDGEIDCPDMSDEAKCQATPAPDTTVVQPPSTIVQLSSKPTSTSTTSVTDTSSSFSSISPSPPKLSSTTPSALTTLISTTKPSTASSSHQTTSKVSSNTVSSTKLPSSHKPPSTVTYTEPVKPTTMLTPTAEHTTHIPSSPSSSSSVKTSIVTPLTSATGEATSQETPGNSDIEICTQKVIEDFNQITIITEGYTDGVNYPLNQNCEMEVPGDKDDVLVMTIEEFSVEQNSYCGWDALFIHFENIIFKLCGYISNTQKLDSTDDCKYGNFVQYDDNLNKRSCFIDNYFSRSFKFTFSGSLLLRFVSDSVINQKGFKIKLQRIKSPLFTMTNPSPTPTTASPAVSASKPESTTAPITHTTDPLTPTSKTPSIQTSKESQNPIKPNFTSQSTTQKSYSTLFTNSTFAPKHTSATFDQSHTDIVSSTKHLTTQPSSDQITHVEVSDSNKEFTVTIPVQSTVTQSSGTNNHSISKTTVSQQVTTAEDSSLSTSKSSTAGISVTVSKSHTQAKTSATPKDQTTKSITAIRTSQLSSKSVSTLTTEPTSTEGILPPACSEDNMPFRLNDDIGYIESPKMSNESTYPPNTVCRWKIEDVNGQLISLIFEWFDLEQSEGCMWDKLGIFEVLTNDEMKTKAVLCGDTLPQTITASSDVLIEFSTDTQGQKTGFRLKFLKTDKANEDSSFTCPPATTPCWSSVPKSCMPVEWICDGEIDCPDMSDEAKCPICEDNEFSCGGGYCIDIQKRCDGHPDCAHGVDEQDCVAISDKVNVEVLVQGNNLPLCYTQTVDSHKNTVCIASLYRASSGLWSQDIADSETLGFAVMDVTESTKAIFSKSNSCEYDVKTRIKCFDQGCGLKSGHTRRKRIIGGTISDDGDWPWTVALRAGNKMICGATVVDKEWVVTAGHCVKDLRKNPHIASIVAGVRDINDVNAQIRYVTEVVLHPDYFYIFNADIALLKLERPLIFNEYVQQICLPWDKREFSLASRCFIAGWGVSNMTEYYTTVAPKYLRHAKTKLVSKDSCIQSYSTFSELTTTINDGMLCAGYTGGGIDACKGDSGSGLMCEIADGRWVLAGIISWGDLCGSTHKPGVYTKVSSYVGWINETLGFPSAGSVNCNFESSDWCGYEAISESKYIWTRKPGDKYISGNILYAVRADYDLATPANATLFTPSFSAGQPSCLGFQFEFSGNSNITLSIYGITEESGTTGVVSKETLLWRITSHYPSIESWQTSETNVPDDVSRLKFVSLHEHGGISGLGLDNVTLKSTPCSNVNFMKCNFDDETTCQFTSHTYTIFNKEWKIKHRGKSKDDYIIWTGGNSTTFGDMALSQLVSPTLTSSFTSLPRCLTFSFYKEYNTTNELKVFTYSEIFQQLTNHRLFWSSEGYVIEKWHKVKVTIVRIVDYFDHIVFEVRRVAGGDVGFMVDNLDMYDGTCL